MTLPVSSYEELLETVRSLTQETRQLQRQLNTPLLTQNLTSGKLYYQSSDKNQYQRYS